MTKDNNIFIKPGQITQSKNGYELMRRKNIEKNNSVFNAMVATSLFGSNRKENNEFLRDVGAYYQSSENESSQSFSSSDEEIATKTSKKRHKVAVKHKSTFRIDILPPPESSLALYPTQDSMDVSVSPSLTLGSLRNTPIKVSSSKRVWCPTRGLDREENNEFLRDVGAYYQSPENESRKSFSSSDEVIATKAFEKRHKIVANRKSTPRIDNVPPPKSTLAPHPTQDSIDVPVSPSPTPHSLRNSHVKASYSISVWGPTRGINTERIMKASGGAKLDVEIPQDVGAPIGHNAINFANWLGVKIRMGAPLKDVATWSEVPPSVKAPVIQATMDKFNVKNFEDAKHVVRGVNLKRQSLYRNWRHKMKKHYLQLLNNGQNPYGKPYKGVSNEDWAWMIDNIWTNPDKEARAEQNRHARLCSLYDHTMGSLSFPAAMSIQAIDDQPPHIADFYKTSHFNRKKNKWVDPICEQLHTQLEARRQEVEAPGSTLVMTQEEIAVDVLSKKSGYLRGYGVGPKPSSSKRFSVSSHQKVQILQNKVQTLTDLCKRQEKKISEYDTQIQRQEEKISEYDTKFECQEKKLNSSRPLCVTICKEVSCTDFLTSLCALIYIWSTLILFGILLRVKTVVLR